MPAEVYVTNYHKGGVGKTTTIANTADALQRIGKRVLLIDTDPQDQIRQFFAPISRHQINTIDGLDEIILSNTSPRKVWKEISPNLKVIPAGTNMLNAKNSLNSSKTSLVYFQKVFGAYLNDFDFILIDTPPTWDETTYAAMFFASKLIAPVQLSDMSEMSLEPFLDYVKIFQNEKSAVGSLDVAFIQPNFLDFREDDSRQLLYRIMEYAKLKEIPVLPPIRVNVNVKRLVKAGNTVFTQDGSNSHARMRILESQNDFNRVAQVMTGNLDFLTAWQLFNNELNNANSK